MPPMTASSASRLCGGNLRKLSSSAGIGEREITQIGETCHHHPRAGAPLTPTTSAHRRPRMITIDDFSKLDLRVATIVSAAPHPNADRLLVLEIDLGTERRQLVAGIRAHYAPDDLVGTQIVVIANLEPATLRGVRSEGMLLAATDAEGTLAVVGPRRPVAAGARVK
ncbi:MAG TPA: methionine--tRNA ligase subunit beta [Candidatus Binatia bacterium]|nr:methionine--tRNA ligase subunit beta [Candidatus Binatia bacterium]